LDITPRLLELGVRVPIFRVRDRSQLLMEVDFSVLDTPYPFTLMCPQEDTEAVLNDRLTVLGGAITRGAEVTSVEVGYASSNVHFRHGNFDRKISAKWVVGCDGAHSIVRKMAGIGFEGGEYDEVFALADVHLKRPLARDEVSLFFSPLGLLVIAPLPRDRFRIVATVDRAPEHPTAAFIEKLIAERGLPGAEAQVQDVVWSSRFKVGHRVADCFVKNRTILCGDAAHVHSPAGGQGMNTGIQDAIALAGPLLTALRTNDPACLGIWMDARRQIAKKVVSTTDRMTRAATLQAPAGRLLRNAAISIAGHVPGVPHLIARMLAELDRS
jgi:2-polyprenyl-6-methoxyphenol hydroxylase-like FAD-dependent oxidoreductase